MSIEMSMKIQGLERLKSVLKESPAIVREQMQKAISLSAILVQRKAREEAPVKTGTLRRGIKSKIVPFKGTIESKTKYGYWVHKGTDPYIIRPVRKKALFWKGARHPVKRVSHPGIKANPFMKRGMDKSERQVQVIFQKAIDNVVNKIAK